MKKNIATLVVVVGLNMLFTYPVQSVTTTHEWIELLPTGTLPESRAQSGNAYDEANDRLIIFAGAVISGFPYPNDIWVLTDATGMGGTSSWVQLSPAGSAPEGRNQTSAVYDPTSNRLIVHGGINSNVVSLNDTWALTFANGLGGTPQWLALPSAPISRVGHASAYDAFNNRMIVFAGSTGPPGTERNDVWILKDANGTGAPTWEQLLPAGPFPTPRTHSQAVYDRLSNRLIVFGGRGGGLAFNDVWVLNNANGLGGTPQWMQIFPSSIPPAPRGGHVMFYDSEKNSCIVFGGGDEQANPVFNDSWILTEANSLGGVSQWIKLDPDGGPPLARFWPSAGYSTMARRLIITMGNQLSFPNYLTDTWVLTEESIVAPVEVSVDIKPESIVNSIHPRSNGEIPVAIITTATFDATTVDPMSVRFGPNEAIETHGRGLIEDVDGDGDSDLVLHFRVQSTGIMCGTTSASLRGQDFGGQLIIGSDSINTVGCN